MLKRVAEMNSAWQRKKRCWNEFSMTKFALSLSTTIIHNVCQPELVYFVRSQARVRF